jgi:hypothetical protein
MVRPMTKNDMRETWTKRYGELLRDFTESLGGEQITPTRRAMAKTLASLQTQLLALNDKFASSGGSPDEMAQFLRISTAITDLLAAAGVGQTIREQSVPTTRETEDLTAELRHALNFALSNRLDEQACGIFRDRNNEIVDTADHPQGCRCQPCTWHRERQDIVAVSDIGNVIPEAPHEPAVVKAPAPLPQLRVVQKPAPPSQPVSPPAKAESAPPPSVGDLQEQRRILTNRCDDLRRQISALCDRALTNTDARSQRDRMQADLNVPESELNQLNASIAKATPSEATRLFFENPFAGRSPYDMSPDPSWPRLR